MVILEVDDVDFDYADKSVLEEISFNVTKGEIIGVLGPNGCGKTTLLKILNRNLHPKKGVVIVEDVNIADITKKEIAQKMAVVPQGGEINFAFTVTDIVMMGRMPSMKRFEMESDEDLRVVWEAMKRTRIEHLADRLINEISGGERQRVIIARALAQQPQIILMDEPTLHLDVNHQLEILDLVRELSRTEGLTVVIVSHDLSLVSRYCDRIILINDHRILAAGTVEEVLTPENMRKVFSIEASLDYDERIGGYTVSIFRPCR